MPARKKRTAAPRKKRANAPRKKRAAGKGTKPRKTPPRKLKPAAVPAWQSKVWITAADFLKWSEFQGVSLSKKNLYATYLGTAARHPIPRRQDNRLHKHKAMELVRVVQGKALADTDQAAILAERNLAETRLKTARAAAAELKVARMRGDLVETVLVRQTWDRRLAALRDSFRTLAQTAPTDLDGQTQNQMEKTLAGMFDETFRRVGDNGNRHIQ